MSARVVKGNFKEGGFVISNEGVLFGVFVENVLIDVSPTEGMASLRADTINNAYRRKSVEKERELLAQQEAQDRENMKRGVIEPLIMGNDLKLLQRVVKLAAIARQAARTQIAITAFDEDGKPTKVVERIANEDVILVALLNQQLGLSEGATA